MSTTAQRKSLKGTKPESLLATREEAVGLAVQVMQDYHETVADPAHKALASRLNAQNATIRSTLEAASGLYGRVEALERPWWRKPSAWAFVVLVALVGLLTGCVKANPVALEECEWDAQIVAEFNGATLAMPDTVLKLGCPQREE